MKGRDGEVKGFRFATGPSRVELQVKTQDDSICHNFRANDSDAGRDDSPRFGYTPRTTSPDIKCLTSQTRPFWFRAIPSGRDTGPHECDIANHDAKITLCICEYLSLCRASLPPYFHVHVHQSVSSLTADQNIHSAWGTFCNFDFFFFFFSLGSFPSNRLLLSLELRLTDGAASLPEEPDRINPGAHSLAVN